MTRNLPEILGELRSLTFEDEQTRDEHWNRLLDCIDALIAQNDLPSAETELIGIFEGAPVCSFSIEALSRLNDTAVSDQLILAAKTRIRPDRKSLWGGVYAYPSWGSLGVICAGRPHLLPKIIDLPMDKIYFYHDARTVEAVLDFTSGETSSPYLQHNSTPAGFQWLCSEMKNHTELILQQLHELRILEAS